MNFKLDDRLRSVASFVKEGATVIDVGTDHAYLPIHLIETGTAVRALATDINEGPLKNAEDNVNAHGLSHKIALRLANGLDGAENFGADTVLICGMGGELIADILNRAPFVKQNGIRLVLQPMTFADKLREYLLSNGFRILDEALSTDNKKLYTAICAEYDGVERKYGEVELLIGRCNIENRGEPLREAFIRREIRKLTKVRDGKESGHLPHASEDATIAALLTLI